MIGDRRLAGGAVIVLVTAAAVAIWGLQDRAAGHADPDDAVQVARGQQVYAVHCASCHGANLEGQPDWRTRLANGRLPAPPHGVSGHTWHHPDHVLFEITRDGVAAFAPKGYESDMPGFGATLTDDEIWAALAFIKSRWPAEIRVRQAQLSRQAR